MLDCAAEKRYRRILLSGVELNKDFYFSYTYNLGQTLQASLTAEQPRDCFESRFVWNEYLSRSGMGAVTHLAVRLAAAATSGMPCLANKGQYMHCCLPISMALEVALSTWQDQV